MTAALNTTPLLAEGSEGDPSTSLLELQDVASLGSEVSGLESGNYATSDLR